MSQELALLTYRRRPDVPVVYAEVRQADRVYEISDVVKGVSHLQVDAEGSQVGGREHDAESGEDTHEAVPVDIVSEELEALHRVTQGEPARVAVLRRSKNISDLFQRKQYTFCLLNVNIHMKNCFRTSKVPWVVAAN